MALRQFEHDLELVIGDDGAGLDVPTALARAGQGATLGLLSMQQRTRLAGGELEIKSTPGAGTEVRARASRSTKGRRMSEQGPYGQRGPCPGADPDIAGG